VSIVWTPVIFGGIQSKGLAVKQEPKHGPHPFYPGCIVDDVSPSVSKSS
jgi:hypothetical protein